MDTQESTIGSQECISEIVIEEVEVEKAMVEIGERNKNKNEPLLTEDKIDIY
jgi:hypothetical protein